VESDVPVTVSLPPVAPEPPPLWPLPKEENEYEIGVDHSADYPLGVPPPPSILRRARANAPVEVPVPSQAAEVETSEAAEDEQ